VRIPLSRTSAVAAALASAAVLSGCGSDAEAKQDCLRDAYNTAEAAAVARAYNEGKLGSREQIESELTGPGRRGATFFDSSGELIPYARLDLKHQVQFVAWMTTGRVGELTFDARERARANADPDC
jgi:hypothetical protein